MRAAWSGGQYSLLRAAFGAAVAVALAFEPGPAWVRATGVVASVLLALGAATPAVALVALGAWARLATTTELAAHPWSALVPLALLVHALLPRAPYGSLPARGRVDPGGGWRIPEWCAWLARGGALALAAGAEIAGDEALAPLPAARLAACIALLFAPLRPYAWLVLATEEALTAAAIGDWHALPARMLALGILFEPAWIRPLTGGVARVGYDGACGLCHRAVRFLLAEDEDGSRFRFVALQDPTFAARVPPEQRAGLPDSVVVLPGDGRVLVRSEAALHALERIGGIWRALALVARAVPRPVRDAAYDGVARIRRRLFAAPKEACPLLPRELRGRFEP